MRLRAALVPIGAVLAVGLAVGASRVAGGAAPTFEAPDLVAANQQDAQDPLAGFALPVWLSPPRGLSLESSGRRLVTWSASGPADPEVRIMAPTVVRPDDARPAPAPADFHGYLAGLRASGARLTDDRSLEVGGVPAHRFTLTTLRPIPDGLGCWSDRAEDCLTLAAGITMTVVTLEVQHQPVVLWSRTWSDTTDPRLDALLDRLLGSLTLERWGRSAQHRSESARPAADR